MVVFVVHILGTAIYEVERHASIGLHGDSPLAFTVSFELVESEGGDIHVSDVLSLVELGQNETEPLGMGRLNPCGAPPPKEQLQSLVRKGFNHDRDCNRSGYIQQL